MMKILYFLPLFFFAACVSNPVDPIQELLSKPMTEADSLHYMDLLLEDMETERMEFVKRVQETCDIEYPVFCGKRCVFSILINGQDQIMVRDEFTNKITERLFEYYAYNMKDNDVTSNFPLYSRVDSVYMRERFEAMQEERFLVSKELKNDDRSEMLDFLDKQIDEWERKMKVLKTLKSFYLIEHASNCVVKIECQNVEKHKERLLNEAMKGFYLLRDLRAQEYFQESYLSIYRRASLLEKQEDLDKLEALQELHAIRMISNDEDCEVVINALPPPRIME